MKQSTAFFVAAAKRHYGDASMSDRELGAKFGVSQQYISKAKSGNMSDGLAFKIADAIKADPIEVLLVARAERETNRVVKQRLLAHVKETWRRL